MEAPIYLKGRARRGPTFREALLVHAVARLALHPWITNVQASWVKLGLDGAAAALRAGVNDLGGTLMNESISRAAGASHGQELPPEADGGGDPRRRARRRASGRRSTARRRPSGSPPRSARRRSQSRSTRRWTRPACAARPTARPAGPCRRLTTRGSRGSRPSAPDGRPHVVPICFAIDGDMLYTAVDEKPKRTRRLARLRNIEANPRVEVLVDHYDEDWTRLWWVRLRGTARIVEDRRAVELLAAKYPQYRAEPPAGPVIAVDDRGAERVDGLAFLSATEQADLVRRGEVEPVELVETYLERIERIDPELNAYVTVCAEEARRPRRGDLPDGPFRGVPLPIKDLNETAGIRTTFSYAGVRRLRARTSTSPSSGG